MKKAINLKMIAILALFLGAYGFLPGLKSTFLSVDKAYGGEDAQILKLKKRQNLTIIFSEDEQKEIDTQDALVKLLLQELAKKDVPQREPEALAPSTVEKPGMDVNELETDLIAYIGAFHELKASHEAFERKMEKYQTELAKAKKAIKSKTRQTDRKKLENDLETVRDHLVSEHGRLRQSVESIRTQMGAIEQKAPSWRTDTKLQLDRISSDLDKIEMSPVLLAARMTDILDVLDMTKDFNAQASDGTCDMPDHSSKPNDDIKKEQESKDQQSIDNEVLAILKGLKKGQDSAGESFVADEYLAHLASKGRDWRLLLDYFKSGAFLKNAKAAESTMEAMKTILKKNADEYWKNQDQPDELDQMLFGIQYVGLDPRNPNFGELFGQHFEKYTELGKDLKTLKAELAQKLQAYETAEQDKKEEALKSYADVWMKLEATQALRESLAPILVKAREDGARYQAIIEAQTTSPDSQRQPMSPEQMLWMEMGKDLFDDGGFAPQRGPAIDFNIRVGSGQPSYDPFGGGFGGGDPFGRDAFGGGFDGGWGAAPDPRAQFGVRVGGN